MRFFYTFAAQKIETENWYKYQINNKITTYQIL